MTNVNITRCKHDIDLTCRTCALCYNEQKADEQLKAGRHELVFSLDFGAARIEAPALLTGRDREKLKAAFELLMIDPVAEPPEKPERLEDG